MSSDQDNPYRLSKRHNQSWFDRKILPEYEALIGKVIFPRIAVVSGQPGSGKSTAKKIVQTSFGLHAETLVVDMDELRDFHPHIDKIREKHALEMSAYTADDADSWKLELSRRARRSRSPLIYEHTLRRTPSIEETMQGFVADGYEVDLHCVANNSRASVRNIAKRYTDVERKRKNEGRWVKLDIHHDAYEAFPANAQYFQDGTLLRLITVFNSKEQLFSSLRTDDGWDKPDRVEDVINAERNKPWSQVDRDAHLKEWQRLDAAMKASSEFPAFIIEEAAPFIKEAHYLAKSRALTPDDDKTKGTVVHTSPHCVFVEFENGDIAEVAQLPKKKIDLIEGDAWLPRPYPARRKTTAISASHLRQG